MTTLYEILEVSEKASDEIIEKAYKTLAKKYHPDLQPAENKKIAEEKMKKLNDAYSILSDKRKREEYDAKLENIRRQEEMQKQINTIKNQEYQQRETNSNTNVNYTPEYNYAYIKNQYEKQQFKKKLYNIRDIALTVLIIIGIFGLLWILPPTRKMIMDFYNSNEILQAIVGLFLNNS